MRNVSFEFPFFDSKSRWRLSTYAATAFPPCLASRICEMTLRMAALEPGLVFFPPPSRRVPCASRVPGNFLAGEHFAPAGQNRLHLLERSPFFARVFEEEIFVQKATIGHACNHLPIRE